MVKQSDNPTALILTRGNRLTGLLRELEEALREEDSSLELWRAAASLRILVGTARGLSAERECASKELEHARHARRRPPFKLRLP